MIAMIVGQLHVGTSDLAVVRHLISKVRGGLAGWKAMPRDVRHDIMKSALRAHHRNQDTYRFVMSGGRVRRRKAA